MDSNIYQRENSNYRTQLFGHEDHIKYPTSKTSSPYVSSSPLGYSQSILSQLESQNDLHINSIGQKVKALKNMSLKIGEEIRESNKTLQDLSNTFDQTKSSLKKTVDKVILMAQRSRISFKIWLTIFLTVFLLYFYIWIR